MPISSKKKKIQKLVSFLSNTITVIWYPMHYYWQNHFMRQDFSRFLFSMPHKDLYFLPNGYLYRHFQYGIKSSANYNAHTSRTVITWMGIVRMNHNWLVTPFCTFRQRQRSSPQHLQPPLSSMKTSHLKTKIKITRLNSLKLECIPYF